MQSLDGLSHSWWGNFWTFTIAVGLLPWKKIGRMEIINDTSHKLRGLHYTYLDRNIYKCLTFCADIVSTHLKIHENIKSESLFWSWYPLSNIENKTKIAIILTSRTNHKIWNMLNHSKKCNETLEIPGDWTFNLRSVMFCASIFVWNFHEIFIGEENLAVFPNSYCTPG